MADVYGKIFTKEEAEKQFGKVTYSVDMKTEEVKKIIESSPVGIMFKFVDEKLNILNKQRKNVYGSIEPESSEVYNHYSTGVFEELLVKGKQDLTTFQMRGETFTVQNGEFVLEEGIPCPPLCH